MKNLNAVFFISLLCGCATQTPQLTDVRVNALAVADVLTATCQTLQPDVSTYAEYRKSASKLLSVASLNSALYEESYKKVTRITESKSKTDMLKDCGEFIPKIAAMIPEMHKDYEAYVDLADIDAKRQAQAWANAVELFAIAATQVGSAMSTYNYAFIPIPYGRVKNIAPNPTSSKTYNHYLVNTPDGARQCHVPKSGHIFCT